MMRSVLRSALAGLVTLAAVSVATAAEPIKLITPEEALLPAAAAGDGPSRNLTRGPGIDRVAPSTVGLDGGPFRFAFKFKPRNGVAVDPTKVRVTYQRDPSVDLSERLKPYVTPEGIEVKAVTAPPGKHVIEIEATDKEGRVGRGQFTLTVEAPK